MAGECEINIGGNLNTICGYKPKQGIQKKYYVNFDDIDRAATTLANRNTKISALTLKAGAKIYDAAGNDKSHIGKAEGVVGDYGNGAKHTDVLNIIYNGENERERVQEIIDGARVVTIIKKVDGGESGELTFEILGFEAGMTMSSYSWDSSANSGVATIEVASKDGEEEATPPKLFLDTDITTTQAWIDANVYVPV